MYLSVRCTVAFEGRLSHTLQTMLSFSMICKKEFDLIRTSTSIDDTVLYCFPDANDCTFRCPNTQSRGQRYFKDSCNIFSHQDIDMSCKQHKLALTIPKRAILKVRLKTHSALNAIMACNGNSLFPCRGFR